MKYGICHLSIIPLRAEANDRSELVSQVLYGETLKVLERRKKWSRIRLSLDLYEGWVDNKQFLVISEEAYKNAIKKELVVSSDMMGFISDKDKQLLPIPMGSSLSDIDLLHHSFEGNKQSGKFSKENIVQDSMLYLNAPYLWGGKTLFGIDCSGFTQMVYRLNGHKLFRDASQQATQGEALSFIEESEPGDLAFFDNSEGNITHVGIIMKDHYIIHAHGKVRIDRLDHSGIFNSEIRSHTHKLRVIKKII